jgi:hypothetical protein
MTKDRENRALLAFLGGLRRTKRYFAHKQAICD